MNQQRSRRFRSAQEAKEKEEEAAEFVKLLQAGGKDIHESLANKKVWDSNAITPGTPFMDTLASSIRYWVAYKLNKDPAWAKVWPSIYFITIFHRANFHCVFQVESNHL